MREKFKRQGFLGEDAQESFKNIRVAVVGFGGGGSHVGQQLWHIGFESVVVFDDDIVEDTNTNRLIGVYYPNDVIEKTPKVDVARRLHRQICGSKNLEVHRSRWQEKVDILKLCHVVVGCVDSYSERDQLERVCRQFMIPYIDIGLDISIVADEAPQMGGQVILSMPGFPCMRCLGFLDDEKLSRERSQYGDGGPRAQVVWANGVLASKAVGLVVDLASDWTRSLRGPVYLSYNGNTNETKNHVRLLYIAESICGHHSKETFGSPKFRSLQSANCQ